MSNPTLPPRFEGNINFNAQHSPMGAFMSFTCGHFGSGGGIGVEIGRPADQNLFIGVKEGDRRASTPIVCLPFARGASAGAQSAADFQIEQATVSGPAAVATGVHVCDPKAVSRHYGWATDAWVTGDVTFSVYTPFGTIPEPGVATAEALKAALLPAVIATVRIDNRKGATTRTGVFAIDFIKPGARVLAGDAGVPFRPGTVGFGWKRSMGVLARVERDDSADTATGGEPMVFQRWSVAEGVAGDNPVHLLGTSAGVAFEVPPGVARTLVLSIGVYLDGIVTTGLEARYLYTRHYTGLEDVLATALDHAGELRSRCARLDQQLADSRLSRDQQFIVAHATRSYYGSTELLDMGGEPIWIVNEGEYCMMNTLDLSVDQVFWELDRNAWVVRNLLDFAARRYSYVDEVRSRTGQTFEGGISFTHDVGAHNNFSAPGHSSYELPRLAGCFSYMTAEQLCNWILLATCYVARSGDDAWLRRTAPTIRACLQSLVNRGGDIGIVQYDSSRCLGGQEITTYDSLDHSLAQTRNNVYMAVKCWASFVGLAMLAEALGDEASVALARDRAERVAAAVVANAGPDGVIPAVFERNNPGHGSRILPAAEGLMYVLYWERTPLAAGTFAGLMSSKGTNALIDVLKRYVRELLLDPEKRNQFPDGGIRLSSTSGNSWMSKIAIFQHVSREMFGFRDDPAIMELFKKADAAHVKWQTDGSSFWACCDQIVNGEARGSKYYPRIIASALWLDEPVRAADSAASSSPNRQPSITR